MAVDYDLKVNECPYGIAYKIYNIGGSSPVRLMDFIELFETIYGKTVRKDFLPMQPGDVYKTNADTSKIFKELGFAPIVSLKGGLLSLLKWYNEYYGCR